jgi:hypothetical protein
MRKTTIAIIIYTIGLAFGAFFLGLWDAETGLLKAGLCLVWTVIFLIVLFYAEKNNNN